MPTSARAPAVPLRRLAFLLGGLAMFGPFAIDTIFPAFPAMRTQFGVDQMGIQQTLSAYLVAFALMSVVHGPLSDAVGRKKVILVGLAVFTLASVGCALAPDLATLLVFRVLQGLSAGVGMIVGRAVIRDVLHGDDAQRLMSQVSMIFGIAPAIAPIIGGWILGWSAWPAIFWFMVGFGLLLLAATWIILPETHPPEARLKVPPRRLLRDYAAIFVNPRFQRLAAAGAFNFTALFLYIASAPVFVMDILGMAEDQLGWFFVPTIGGMVLGAWLSGRSAGRISGARLTGIGFACCGVAVTANIVYNLLVSEPALPWAVLPMTLNAFGIALVFPILTLAILDMYPRQRGSASSLQAFTGLVLHSVVAGVVSPLLSRDPLWLALGAAVFAAIAWAFWYWETRRNQSIPDCPAEAAALEPTERL
ncbi:multidrug effflux MFS transporter [Marilutibacter alkalisoli]|uniref:Bcr/CflA family efflux transporter n=1 Tax=Marilutibacter alkalisoli TaxID=2591633 RepID=A0A514BQH7_9GAMM|nr:multidrug effflux MFS transporter [Lysobacter alkalisoli]QDH69653.1 multidrug effflux MFS transporter [Lysobacter alkalisoli]